MRTKLLALLSLGAAGLVPAATAQEIPLTRIDIDVAQEKAEIAPTMYGVFFEDINRSADGGIYAELIFNRGFEEANLPSAVPTTPETSAFTRPINRSTPRPNTCEAGVFRGISRTNIRAGRSNVRPTANTRSASATPTIWASKHRRPCT